MLAKRVFNIREGWQPATTGCRSGCCPSRWRLGSGRVAELTPQRLRGMIGGYYAARGLDAPGGRPATRPTSPIVGV